MCLTFPQEFVGFDLEYYMLMLEKSFTEFRISLKIFFRASRSGKRKGSATLQPPTFKVRSKGFALICWGLSPLFFVIASKGCAYPSH